MFVVLFMKVNEVVSPDMSVVLTVEMFGEVVGEIVGTFRPINFKLALRVYCRTGLHQTRPPSIVRQPAASAVSSGFSPSEVLHRAASAEILHFGHQRARLADPRLADARR